MGVDDDDDDSGGIELVAFSVVAGLQGSCCASDNFVGVILHFNGPGYSTFPLIASAGCKPGRMPRGTFRLMRKDDIRPPFG